MIDPEYGTSYAARALARAIARDGDDEVEIAHLVQAVIEEAVAEAREAAKNDRRENVR
jgi:hypothetical protein